MKALTVLLNDAVLRSATASKRSPLDNSLGIWQGVITFLGLVAGGLTYYILSSRVEPHLRSWLERRLGVRITVGSMTKFWNTRGGTPRGHFVVGLVSFAWTVVELAGAIVPFFLLYMWAQSLG